MKVLFGCLAVLLVVGVAPSEALFGIGKRHCLPKPIDSPIVRKNVREDHKAGKHQRHVHDCSLRPIAAPTTANG